MKLTFFILLLSFSQLHAQLAGCTDPLASNYNESASINNGTCAYSTIEIVPDASIVLPAEMDETSGLLIFNDRLLTHNDDTDTNLYSFDPGNPSGFTILPIPFVTNKDWEDIAEDETYIYIGDFGNNGSGNRTDLRIFRIIKSGLEQNPVVDTILFSYEDQTDFASHDPNNTDFDCEAFIVTGDKIYLFTKEWISKKTTVYELEKTPGTHVAYMKSTFNVQGLITGATHLEDRQLVVLSGYSMVLQPFVYLLYDFPDNDFFSGNKRKISISLPFHQVEGIATADGLHYFLSNEKFNQGNIAVDPKILHLDLEPYLSAYLSGDPLSLPESQGKELSSILVYPNPATDFIVVSIPETSMKNDELSIEIVDPGGKKIMAQQVDSPLTVVDLGHFSHVPGILHMLIRNKQNMVVSRSPVYVH